MSALLLVYILIFIAAVAFVSGVFILWGLGWALIAFAATILAFVAFLSRGLINNEE